MIGVVGPDSDAASIEEALDGVDASMTMGSAADVLAADPSAVVALDESGAMELARAGVETPVLPVASGPGLESIDTEDLGTALRRVLDGDYETRRHPVLEVSLGGDRVGRALFDAMLVTTEPGRISEFRVRAGRPVDQFRADGVVIATPAGSYGYANAAGGPILERGGGLVAVVPVSAFTIRTEQWVFEFDGPITVTVEREESDVSLLVDDRERPNIPLGEPVTVRSADALEAIVLEDV